MLSRTGSPPEDAGYLLFEGGKIERVVDEGRLEIDGRPIQCSLLNEGGLADAPPSVQNDQRPTWRLEFTLENGKILLASDEIGHCTHTFLIEIIIS
jgi:hypothetical protein